MTTPVTFDEDGDVVGGDDVVASEALSPKRRKMQAHNIERSAGSIVPYVALEKVEQNLFMRQMEYALYSTYAVNETVAREYLEIVKVEVLACT